MCTLQCQCIPCEAHAQGGAKPPRPLRHQVRAATSRGGGAPAGPQTDRVSQKQHSHNHHERTQRQTGRQRARAAAERIEPPNPCRNLRLAMLTPKPASEKQSVIAGSEGECRGARQRAGGEGLGAWPQAPPHKPPHAHPHARSRRRRLPQSGCTRAAKYVEAGPGCRMLWAWACHVQCALSSAKRHYASGPLRETPEARGARHNTTAALEVKWR